MRDSEKFTANAVRAREDANAATLHNVRERSLRAEAAWTVIAIRSRKTEAARDAREAGALAEAAPEVFCRPRVISQLQLVAVPPKPQLPTLQSRL